MSAAASAAARPVRPAPGRLSFQGPADWPYPDDADFVVLRDPDGNEFCVIDHGAL